MRYFVRWYDESTSTEVSEEFMKAFTEFNESFDQLESRHWSKLPRMILIFESMSGNEMYFIRTYIDENGKIMKEDPEK